MLSDCVTAYIFIYTSKHTKRIKVISPHTPFPVFPQSIHPFPQLMLLSHKPFPNSVFFSTAYVAVPQTISQQCFLFHSLCCCSTSHFPTVFFSTAYVAVPQTISQQCFPFHSLYYCSTIHFPTVFSFPQVMLLFHKPFPNSVFFSTAYVAVPQTISQQRFFSTAYLAVPQTISQQCFLFHSLSCCSTNHFPTAFLFHSLSCCSTNHFPTAFLFHSLSCCFTNHFPTAFLSLVHLLREERCLFWAPANESPGTSAA